MSEPSCFLDEGDIGSLLGPSGCGKTTVLCAIAGFEQIGRGKIRPNPAARFDAGHVVFSDA